MNELFGKDYQFALATTHGNIPSVRFIDAYYENESFYIVTHRKSQKVKEIHNNSHVSLTNRLYKFNGQAYDIGHPLDKKNKSIRERLIKVFQAWYFEHNNEDDEHMCYIEIKLADGFFYKDGTAYQVDFKNQLVKTFPFNFDIVPIS